MRRRRSSSRSRSPGSSRSRNRRSPSEYRSMTRSRSNSRSPSRSRSRDRGRPLRSKYARSASSVSRSPSPASGMGRPPSRGKPVSTVDLTRMSGNERAPSWHDSMGKNEPPASHPNFNEPPPSYSNPPPAQPMESKPIPSVGLSQMRFPPPSHSMQDFSNFQGDFPNYGSSVYQGENRNYPDGQPMNNFNAPPGPNYAPMGGGGWSYPPGNGNSQSGFDGDFSNPPPTVAAPERPPPVGIPTMPPTTGVPPTLNASEGIKNAAVEQELVHQRKTLAVQREEYFKKRIAMTRDLKALREQADSLIELGGSKTIIKENSKLQDEMLEKIKSMDNVIDMLTHIIGDREQIADLLKGFASALELPPKKEAKKEEERRKPEKRRKSKSRSRSRSPSRKKKDKPKKKSSTPDVKVNIEHYDPELHWCSLCNVFPRSAVEYLNHLHSDVHTMALKGKKAKERPDEEFKPWRTNEAREPSPPVYKDAPSKRVPIRGVPFLVPATAWYCSLCKTWLGELELANRHLKGPKHAAMYTEFVSQNPHWEVDWLRDRTRAYEKNSEARAKVEEISKQLATKKDKPEMNLEKLKEMLASVKKKTAADKRHRSVSSSSSSSESSSSEGSDQEDKKKGRKKKGKEEEKKKKKKKKPDDEDKESRDKKKKGGDKKDKPSRERSDDRTEHRPDRSTNRPTYSRGGYYNNRGRGRPFHRGSNRGGYSQRYDRGSQEKSERSPDSDGGRDKKREESPPRTRPFRSDDHDWDRVKPTAPPAKPRPDNRIIIGKRPGLGGGIARDKIGFQRTNVFERLDKNKPDELYGPLEPPKNG